MLETPFRLLEFSPVGRNGVHRVRCVTGSGHCHIFILSVALELGERDICAGGRSSPINFLLFFARTHYFILLER